jgi:acyl-CoA hydrolase
MQWMDEVEYITATPFTLQHMFIVNTENIKFLKAVNPNCIAEAIGRIEKVEAVKLKVKVEFFVKEMYNQACDKLEKPVKLTTTFQCKLTTSSGAN